MELLHLLATFVKGPSLGVYVTWLVCEPVFFAHFFLLLLLLRLVATITAYKKRRVMSLGLSLPLSRAPNSTRLLRSIYCVAVRPPIRYTPTPCCCCCIIANNTQSVGEEEKEEQRSDGFQTCFWTHGHWRTTLACCCCLICRLAGEKKKDTRILTLMAYGRSWAHLYEMRGMESKGKKFTSSRV